jgi:hypothetical protein
MGFYKNEAPGARMVRMKDRTTVLIDTGRTVPIDGDHIASVPFGVVEVDKNGKAIHSPLDHDGNGKPGGAAQADPASDDAIKAALGLLDPEKDEHWTQAGIPSVEAVAEIADGKVTRDQIKALAPDLTRETAKKG